MDNRTHFEKTYIIIIAILLFISSDAISYDPGDWKTYTSTTEVRYIDYFEDSLQVITSGGWLKIDPDDLGIRKLTNVDGLGTGDLYDIMRDGDGAVWVAGYGRLIKCSSGIMLPFLFFDRNNELLTLYSIADDGDMIWVGTSSGLAMFSKTTYGGQIEDFYFRFGDLNPEPAVYDVLVRGDSIWLATSAGMAAADKSNPDLLKSFINWTTFGSSDFPELAGDTVSTLTEFKGSIYLGTTRNSYRLLISNGDTSFIKISTREPVRVNKLVPDNDTLGIYTNNGFYLHTIGGTQWGSAPTIPDNKFLSGRFISDTHWIGMKALGLYYGSGSDFAKLEDGGLPGNYITSLASDKTGRVAGGFQTRGAATFDGEEWTRAGIVGTIPGGTREGVRAVAFDDFGNLWAGTWGNGAMQILADTIINFDENNSALRGILTDPNYVVVNSMVAVPGNLFMTNYAALDGRSVVVIDIDDNSQWDYFGRQDSLTSDNPVSIDYYDGTFAVATQNTGVFMYYCGQNPFIETGFLAVNLREENSNLGSNTVNVVKFDHHGTLWAGTKYGLSRYDSGIPRFDDIVLPSEFGPAVTALAFDGRDNLWIGTASGLAFYNTATGEFTVYDILNSGLPNNRITSLTVNPATGDLWAGTPSGLARFKSSIGPPTRNVGEVIAFPNPFIIRDGSERLGFNYDGTAVVRIFTSSGEIVRKMPVNIFWDGKNQEGEEVAAGVYLALITDEDGSVGRCKIVLIRD